MFIDLIYLDTTFQYVTYHLFFVLNDLPLNNMTYPSGYSKCYLYHTLNIILVMYKTYMCPPKLTIKIVEQIISMEYAWICMLIFKICTNFNASYDENLGESWQRVQFYFNEIRRHVQFTFVELHRFENKIISFWKLT